MEPVRYSESEDVRRYLVLHALSFHAPHFDSTLASELQDLHARIIKFIASGRVALDFPPPSATRVGLPSNRDPLYMQALLYWCSKLGCGIAELVEAHARLGAEPLVAEVKNSLRGVHEDWSQTDGARVNSRQLAIAATVPMITTPARPARRTT